MTGSVPRTMSVYCDETGAHNCAYFAWGSIWMAHERLDEFNARIDAIAKRHGVKGEFGWKDSQPRAAFCKEVVQWFFQQRWVCFQSLFVRKQDMRIFTSERLKNDTVAYKKLLCTMVAVNAANFDALPGGPRQFRIIVDQVGDKPAVAEEEYRIVAAAIRKRTDGRVAPVAKFARVDSQSARGIQLADLLVGAIRAEWEAGGKAVKRGRLRAFIAECLGWENLLATTPRNLKFNIWLHNACEGYGVHSMRLKYPQGDPEAAFGGGVVVREPVRVGGGLGPGLGERVEARGEGGLTLTITRAVGDVRAGKVVPKKVAGKVVPKKVAERGLTKKEKKAERAEARAERMKGKKARVRAWAKRKTAAQAKKKAKKQQWEARVKEKAVLLSAAKAKKKVKEKTK